MIEAGSVRFGSGEGRGSRFHGDDLLNWPFHDVRKSQNWLPAREIAAEIRLDDHAESSDESLENARFPLFFGSYWTYRRDRRHEIEKGRRGSDP